MATPQPRQVGSGWGVGGGHRQYTNSTTRAGTRTPPNPSVACFASRSATLLRCSLPRATFWIRHAANQSCMDPTLGGWSSDTSRPTTTLAMHLRVSRKFTTCNKGRTNQR
jgi:hypothetical protein